MPIGDSKGAFFEDEFRAEAHPWYIDPKDIEGDRKMEVAPKTVYTNKQLDQAELDPSTGTGIEVGLKTEIEDRRSDTPLWDMNRLMDPASITDSIGGKNSTGNFVPVDRDPWIPTDLAKKLGINDIDSVSLSQILKKLGIKPIAEEQAIKDK